MRLENFTRAISLISGLVPVNILTFYFKDKMEYDFDFWLNLVTVIFIIKHFIRKGKVKFKYAKDIKFESDCEAMKNRYIDLYCYDGENFFSGYETYIEPIRGSFILYPFYLLLNVKLVRFFGEKINRNIADSRKCEI